MPTSRVPTVAEIQSHWQGLFDALNHDTDLVSVVTATAYVEHTLGALLRAHFINSGVSTGLLQPVGGSLNDLVKKGKVAYGLGHISEGCLKNIEAIANIRNAFAHSTEILSFADKEIGDLCDALTFPHTDAAPILSHKFPPLPDRMEQYPRRRFTYVAIVLCSYLVLTALSISKCEKRVDYWDQPQSPS
jgi:DNA-binding MltR family transcriptional regulator